MNAPQEQTIMTSEITLTSELRFAVWDKYDNSEDKNMRASVVTSVVTSSACTSIWHLGKFQELVATNESGPVVAFKNLPLTAAFVTAGTNDIFIKVGKTTAIFLAVSRASRDDLMHTKAVFKKSAQVRPINLALVLSAYNSPVDYISHYDNGNAHAPIEAQPIVEETKSVDEQKSAQTEEVVTEKSSQEETKSKRKSRSKKK